MPKALRLLTYETYLFGLLWLLFGLFIRSADLQAYNLQQMGIDALVTHGTFTLGHSPLEILQPRGDVFEYGNQLHAAKQPGQFVFGALAYAPLKMLGLSYEEDFIQTAAWVTWFSSTSFAALAGVILFSLAYRIWGLSLFASLLASLTLALATPLLAYSGVAHHDVIAGTFVLASFYFMERGKKSKSHRDWILMGVASGLAIFTSMLPALIILAFLLTSALHAPKRVKELAVGLLIGSAPLLAHNWYYFGSPLTQANAAGNYQDTFFAPSWSLWKQHLNDYFGTGPISIWKYAPALGLGFLALGFSFLIALKPKIENTSTPKPLFPAVSTLLAITLGLTLHLIYILSIETIGHCQFGPRYLIPTYPLLCLVLAPMLDHLVRNQRNVSSIFLAILVAGGVGFSMALAFVGAQIGTMLCGLDVWLAPAFWHSQAKEIWLSDYPLRPTLSFALLIFLFFIAALELLKRKRRHG